jgi:hypothetical protein
MTHADPKPRVAFLCPQCNQLIARLYTAAQIEGAAMPVLRHLAIEHAPDEGGLSRISGELGPYSVSTDGLRDKGLQNSYVADHYGLTADDIAVSCRCGGKFSVPHAELMQALAAKKGKQVLPTRQAL